MDASSAHIAVQPGDGLVGRFGDTVLLVAGPVSEEDPFVEHLVGTVEAGAAETDVPGAALAQRIGELLFRADSAHVASFGLVAPVEGGALVLLHGDVDAEISQPSGVSRLSGRQAVTWVDHVVHAPFDRVALTRGEAGPVSVHPRSDLRVGVVPGGGFVLSPVGRAPEPVAAPVAPVAPIAPVAAAPHDDPLPTEATEAAMAPDDDEIVAPHAPRRETAAPFDQAEDITPPQAGRPTIGAQSPFEAEDGPTGPPRQGSATMAVAQAPELVGEDGYVSRLAIGGVVRCETSRHPRSRSTIPTSSSHECTPICRSTGESSSCAMPPRPTGRSSLHRGRRTGPASARREASFRLVGAFAWEGASSPSSAAAR